MQVPCRTYRGHGVGVWSALAKGTTSIRFKATKGSSYTGDMALDLISVSNNHQKCTLGPNVSSGSCPGILGSRCSCKAVCASGKLPMVCSKGSTSQPSGCCAPGTTWDGINGSLCLACVPGQYDHDSDPHTACAKCSVGQASSANGSTSCMVCPAGTTTLHESSNQCEVLGPCNNSAPPGYIWAVDNGSIAYPHGDGNYTASQVCKWALKCSNSSLVPLVTFSTFDTHSGIDFTTAYDGTAPVSTALHRTLSGGGTPSPIMFGSSVGALQFATRTSPHLMNPAETARSYSSVHADDQPGEGHARSMLDSAQAWSSKRNQVGEWMQLDLGQTKAITHIVTQGRINYDQWVTEYKVQHSTDGSRFTAVSAPFSGNTDRSTSRARALAVNARYLRIYPQKWNGHMSMRAGVIAGPYCPVGGVCENATGHFQAAFTCTPRQPVAGTDLVIPSVAVGKAAGEALKAAAGGPDPAFVSLLCGHACAYSCRHIRGMYNQAQCLLGTAAGWSAIPPASMTASSTLSSSGAGSRVVVQGQVASEGLQQHTIVPPRFVISNQASMVMQYAHITGHVRSGYGESLHLYLGEARSTYCMCYDHMCVLAGGGIHLSAKATANVVHSKITDNVLVGTGSQWIEAGGGIYLTGGSTLSVSNTLFADNVVDYTGSAIFATGSTVTVMQSAFERNICGKRSINYIGGGAVYATSSTVQITECVFRANKASGSSQSGGAIYAYESIIRVLTSTLDMNTGVRAANHAYMDSMNLVYILDSTVEPFSPSGGVSVVLGGVLGGCNEHRCALGSRCEYQKYSLHCEKCRSPTVGLDGMTCAMCNPGTEPNADRTACVKCSLPDQVSKFGAQCELCPPGFTNSADRIKCIDVNECAIANGRCDLAATRDGASCVNSHGSFSCGKCQPGSQGTGATACVSCTLRGLGLFSPDGVQCVACVVGTEPNAVRTACVGCRAGEFSGGSACESCAPGR